MGDVDAAQTAAYLAALHAFDAYLEEHLTDAVAAVEKCRFIDHFASSEDEPITRSPGDLEACRKNLEDVPLANHEEAEVYLLQSKWGEEGIHETELWLRESTGRHWSATARAALNAHLYDIYDRMKGGEARAGAAAWSAVQLAPTPRLTLPAARYLVQNGAREAALRLLLSADTQTRKQWNIWDAVDLLITLGREDVAREVIEQRSVGELSDQLRLKLAQLLARAGDLTAARQILRESAAKRTSRAASLTTLRTRFSFELDYGTPSDASTSYRALRNAGWKADPLGRARLRLLAKYPFSPLRAEDLLGILTLLALFGFLALVPLLVIAPIHYRSVVRRLNGKRLEGPAPWSLRELWYALAAFLCSGVPRVLRF